MLFLKYNAYIYNIIYTYTYIIINFFISIAELGLYYPFSMFLFANFVLSFKLDHYFYQMESILMYFLPKIDNYLPPQALNAHSCILYHDNKLLEL